jgi:NAD(P)H-hydrate epimerase
VLPLALYDAAATRALDREAIEGHGIPGLELMERAGAATWREVARRWPEARRVLILAGGGNNGGDGYVVARLARAAGREVTVLALAAPTGLSGDAARAYQAAVAAGVPVVAAGLPVLLGEAPPPEGAFALGAAGICCDALFGTGLARPLAGPLAAGVAALNAAHARGLPVVAVDLPSGLSADTGAVLGVAVAADLTVTFIGLKQGLFTGDGPDCAGEVVFASLEVPPAIYEAIPPTAERLALAPLLARLPARRLAGHKGDHGHVLVVGGCPGYGGAVCLAAVAALRAGAGLVSIVTHPGHRWLSLPPEVMCHVLEAPDDWGALAPLLAQADVVAVGPGLGQGEWGQRILAQCLAVRGARPLVVDADALNLLAMAPAGGETRCDRWVLTPHPGEAGRLLGTSTAAVQADRFAAARALQDRYGGTVVLKGKGTLVATAAGVGICTAGNPGMGSGGMGDCLTGAIAALWGQGMTGADAARLAVVAHALAGDKAARAGGERGLVATDLLPHLRRLLN